MTRTLSATAAMLVMTGLMLSLWLLLAVQFALGQVNAVTVVMTVGFTILIALWPFLNGLRVSPQGPQQLLLCFECRQFVHPGNEYGFCIRCGAVLVPRMNPQAAKATPTA